MDVDGIWTPGIVSKSPHLPVTFVRDVNHAYRPYPVPWRPVHSLRLAVAAIAHPLPFNDGTLLVGRFETGCESALEQAVYEHSQGHRENLTADWTTQPQASARFNSA